MLIRLSKFSLPGSTVSASWAPFFSSSVLVFVFYAGWPPQLSRELWPSGYISRKLQKADWNLCSSIKTINCSAVKRWAGKELSFGSFPEGPGLLLEVVLSWARQVSPGRSTSFSCQEAPILATSRSGGRPSKPYLWHGNSLHPSVLNQCFNSLLWWILKDSLQSLQTLNLAFMLKWRNQRIPGSELSSREFPPIHHLQHSLFLFSKIPCTSLSWAHPMVTNCCGDRTT